MAKKREDGHWMEQAFANAHGQLHRALGVPAGKKIGKSALHRAVAKGGVNAKRAQAVLNAQKGR